MSKCHIVGNVMSRLNYVLPSLTNIFTFQCPSATLVTCFALSEGVNLAVDLAKTSALYRAMPHIVLRIWPQLDQESY